MPTDTEREARKLKKRLKDLTEMVGQYLRRLDSVMSQHSMSQLERGKQIVALANALEYANDEARYFGLEVDYHKDKKRLKPKHSFHALERAIQERNALLEQLEGKSVFKEQ